jgi:hypothetical protein
VRVVVIALVAAGCGRVGFDARGTNDATGGMQAQRPCGATTTAPDPVMLAGVTYDYNGFLGNLGEVPQATVAAADRSGTVLATTTSDSAGNYALEIPTGGVAPLLVMTFTQDSFFTTTAFFDAPLDRDTTSPSQQVWIDGDGPLWTLGAMVSVYETSLTGQTVNQTKGSLSVTATDCSGQPLAGVSITVDPEPDELDYIGTAQGYPLAGATATLAPNSEAVGFNAQPGTTHISATAPGYTFEDQTVEVLGGSNMTLIEMRPLE